MATEKQREDALATRDQARATVQAAQAEIANAKLNLGYTEVRAPVAGLTALNAPSIGSLIQAQQTLLTTITPQDPAYVSFSFTDEEGQAFRDLNERRAKPIDEKDLSVELNYGNGRLYAHRGKLDTSAPRVDPQTGTIQARVVFPNPNGLLLPGQFVRLRILGITLLDAIAIRKEAVSQGPQGPFVYVVGANDVAEVRPVRLGQQVGLDWVISDGLKPGERVVVDGVIRVRAGEKVKPVKYVPPVESQRAGTRCSVGSAPVMSKFFIDRPIFATVVSIVILLSGLVAMRVLPIAQYPEIVPPEVVVTATYPGASAQTIAETVAAPLEQQVNGVEGMIYMQSNSNGSGSMTLSVLFTSRTNPDQASINVNNRVQRALPLLPEEVRRQGVTVTKRSSSFLQVLTMSSPDRRYDTLYISNYALINVIDELRRTPGVGDASLFGATDYSMRIWLRPDKVAQYKLVPSDIAAAIREQNAQFAAGRFGEEPLPGHQAFTYSVTTKGQLVDPREFEQIVLRADENGAALRMKDVARVELGSLNYGTVSTLNGAPAVPIGIYLQSGANALEVAAAVDATMRRLSQRFPDGLRYEVPFNTTRFIEASIHEVIKTLVEAILFVVLVVFLFLQNIRATLIPILAVPVSIVGTFAGMYLLGFSINLFTLFGLILAIGIVVDDAIIVLENVERIMTTEGKSPREAAILAMQEVSGPLVAIVLVLCAVFVPVSFLGGLAGELYRQFAVTIAVSVVISGIVALTLTPALCAVFLKPGHTEPWLPFRIFNRGFDWATQRFTGGVGFFLRHMVTAAALIAVMLGMTWWLFQRVPSSLVPPEDQGYNFLVTMLPPAASLDRTLLVTAKVTEGAMKNPAVADVVTIAGYDLLSGAQRTNAGISFVTFKDWSERRDPKLDARNLAPAFAALNADFRDGVVVGFNPPPIPGLSTTGGFEFYLQDRSGGTLQSLAQAAQRVVQAANKRPELSGRFDHLHDRGAAVPARCGSRQGEGARCADQHHLRRRCRAPSAASTSMTSSCSGVPIV